MQKAISLFIVWFDNTIEIDPVPGVCTMGPFGVQLSRRLGQYGSKCRTCMEGSGSGGQREEMVGCPWRWNDGQVGWQLE